MEGMIFAAGLGTRLRPLTDDRPKALVKLKGRTLLERVVRGMAEAGIRRIVVNIHHFADMVERELETMDTGGAEIVLSDERKLLMDTGGGLKKAAGLFTPGSPVLIHNVDIWSELDLKGLMSFYEKDPVYALMVTKAAERGRVLEFDGEGCLSGWMNTETGEKKVARATFNISRQRSFCGIQIVSPDFISGISGTGVFSIIDEYLRQARNRDIKEYPYTGGFADLGTVAALERTERMLEMREVRD